MPGVSWLVSGCGDGASARFGAGRAEGAGRFVRGGIADDGRGAAAYGFLLVSEQIATPARSAPWSRGILRWREPDTLGKQGNEDLGCIRPRSRHSTLHPRRQMGAASHRGTASRRADWGTLVWDERSTGPRPAHRFARYAFYRLKQQVQQPEMPLAGTLLARLDLSYKALSLRQLSCGHRAPALRYIGDRVRTWYSGTS